ncbi:hypothetical protein MXB_4739 [Myxobolus squamalis]|nr:hypothetical protein MXB_4739 [Myxobolus squamalis]
MLWGSIAILKSLKNSGSKKTIGEDNFPTNKKICTAPSALLRIKCKKCKTDIIARYFAPHIAECYNIGAPKDRLRRTRGANQQPVVYKEDNIDSRNMTQTASLQRNPITSIFRKKKQNNEK